MDSPTNDPYASEHEQSVIDDMRSQRDALLKATDWTQVADAPVDSAAWATYRQQLRDLPTSDGWPFIELPTPPA